MKNIIAASFLIATLFSCKKTETTIDNSKITKDSVKVEEVKFSVDSVKVSDSTKLTAKITESFDASVLQFPSIKDKTLQDSIYSKTNLKLASYSKEDLQKGLQDQKQKYFADNKKNIGDYLGDFKQTWNQNSSMKLFNKDENLMTLQYTGDGFSGGAHGYYYEFYKNFDLKNNKTIQLKDVLTTTDAKIWDPIMMKNFLKNKNYTKELLFDKRIPLNNNFYYDKTSLHFVYGQYEIAPYVAGTINIDVPFSEISKYLTPGFKQMNNIK
ncbi:RsiV family protein [Halpernia frigidisoli]|uniref:DUF3298 domain-containing protein n=1 Tax=Halpernia frigidisoli TaxID=1125876 RepID=A0A1I3CW42_9FLAO|nr:RsiV family protein [Halpernia frigidisoli]SFH78657.1 Protein of unknown function [Halpernia frigidisoli]